MLAHPELLPLPGRTLDHYRNVFGPKAFSSYIVNIVIVVGTATAIGLLVAALGAYALARIRLPAKARCLGVVLAISMFPQIALVAPLYQVLNSVHLTNTYEGLVICYVGLWPSADDLDHYGYFRGIPKRDGGGGEDRRLRRATHHLVRDHPAGVARSGHGGPDRLHDRLAGVHACAGVDRHPGPADHPGRHRQLPGLYFVPWGDMAAASIVVTVPLVVLVMVFQRRIIAGVTAGGVKG